MALRMTSRITGISVVSSPKNSINDTNIRAKVSAHVMVEHLLLWI